MEVIGDLSHHLVDGEAAVPETSGRDRSQLSDHVVEDVVRRFDAVLLPHDHRDVADLAVGDPAHVVLVVPRRDARRLAQFTARRRGAQPTTSQISCWLAPDPKSRAGFFLSMWPIRPM